MAHVFVRQAEFLRAEQQRHRSDRQLSWRSAVRLFETPQRMLQSAMADGGRADHQAAIRDGLGQRAGYSRASARTCCAFTAERASRNATSYGFTSRSSANPKLLIARAAAPMFRGLRGDDQDHAQRMGEGLT